MKKQRKAYTELTEWMETHGIKFRLMKLQRCEIQGEWMRGRGMSDSFRGLPHVYYSDKPSWLQNKAVATGNGHTVTKRDRAVAYSYIERDVIYLYDVRTLTKRT